MADMTQEQLDAYIGRVIDDIATHGWILQGVFGDDLPFVYTVGLAKDDLPELVLHGMNPQQCGPVLNSIGALVNAGLVLTDQLILTAKQVGYNVDFKVHGPIDTSKAEMFVAEQLFPGVVVYQIMWPDTNGKFPTDLDYDNDTCPQAVYDN